MSLPDLTEFVVVVREPVFELGAKPGDRILVRVGHERPVVLLRNLREVYGELAGALGDGRVVPDGLNPSDVLAVLARLSPARPSRPRPWRPRSRHRPTG